MKYGYIMAHRGQYWQDSWTYGDWRQYVVERRDGLTQCTKRSLLPGFVSLLGFAFAFFAIMCMATMPVASIDWARSIPFTTLSLLAFAGPFIVERLGYVLMVAVGPPNTKDGRRILPGEE